MPTQFVLPHFNNTSRFLHILNPVTNILHETSGNSGSDPLANKNFWVLVLVDVLKVEAI